MTKKTGTFEEDDVRARYRSFKFYLSIGYTEEIAFGKAFGFPLIEAIDQQHMSLETAIKQNKAIRQPQGAKR